MSDNEAELDRLIAAAKRHDRPAAAHTERAWASLEAAMIGGAGPSVPIELGTSAGAVASGVGLKTLVVVTVTVITAATTAIVAGAIETRDRETIVRKDSAPERRAPANVPAPATLPAELAPAPVAAQPITPEPDPATSPRRAAPIEPAAVAPTDAASTLAEEARLLGDVWRDLNAGDNTAALAKVQEHAQRFPNSPLSRERQAARIVAWCAERKPWAAAQARTFLADRPDGTLAERIERACDGLKKD